MKMTSSMHSTDLRTSIRTRCFKGSAALLAGLAMLLVSQMGLAGTLFETPHGSVLQGELALPLSTLTGKKSRKPTVEGTLTIAGEQVPVTVTPRGKSRLEFCRFPPLWLDFPRKKLQGTVLEGQNRVKLVTHCSKSLAPRGYLAAEMVAYRMLNLLTDLSFRVRAIEMAYLDTEKDKSVTQSAFFIEHKRAAAQRLSFESVDVERLKTTQLEP